jgi:hypothetical protein
MTHTPKSEPKRRGGRGGRVAVRSSLEKPEEQRRQRLDVLFVPTKHQRDLVKLLIGFGMPEDRARLAIINPRTGKPISRDVLRAAFQDEIEIGRVEMDTVCYKGLSNQIRAENMTAIIWYMKNMMWWRDQVDVAARLENRHVMKLTHEELIRQLEERGLPTSVFGIDAPTLDLEAGSGPQITQRANGQGPDSD